VLAVPAVVSEHVHQSFSEGASRDTKAARHCAMRDGMARALALKGRWLVVRPVGVEPTTNGFEVRYSIQLSYGRLSTPTSLRFQLRLVSRLRQASPFFLMNCIKNGTSLMYPWQKSWPYAKAMPGFAIKIQRRLAIDVP
jgi:hypothetical protein